MDSNVSAWTTGGSIFTFAPLYILFIAVAAGLYVLYTKPGLVPGRRRGGTERPVIFTPRPGAPDQPEQARTTENTDKAGE